MVEDGEFLHLTCKPELTIKAPDDSNFIDLETVLEGSNLFLRISETATFQKDVNIIAPYQLKLQDAEVNPQHWVFFKCISNHPITGDPLPYARGLVEVSNGIFCRKDVSAYGGALFTAGDPNVYDGCGGGAVVMGHAFERTDDPPRICLTDYALGERYGTLYITAGESKYVGADAVLANMKLKKLTATGGAKLNAVAIGMDEYGDIPYEYESIQLNPTHNLRFCFGTNQRMMLSNAGRLELPVNGSGGGLKIGDDTNLYRSAQDVLKTDDSFVCSNITGNDAIFNSVKGTASIGALKAGDSGTIAWDGTYLYITAHYRDLQLATDAGKNVIIPRNLTVTGSATVGGVTTTGSGYKNTGASVSWMNNYRSMGTVYQNTTGKTIIVYVTVGVAGVGQPFYTDIKMLIQNSSPPTHVVTRASNPINSERKVLFAVVPNNWYYQVTRSPDSDDLVWMENWYEQVL